MWKAAGFAASTRPGTKTVIWIPSILAVKTKPAKTQRGRTRILIVEDHPMTRDGLAHLINGEPDLTIAWRAENAGQAIEIVSKQRPDLVLTDITLPDKSGLELIKDIRAIHPDVAILVISMHEESLYAERSLRAGARGYITKQEGGERLMQAIRQVLDGKIYVSEKTAARIVEVFSGKSRGSGRSPISQLTDREFDVYQLIGHGKSTKEIAHQLHLSEKTVAVHRGHIKSKLGISSAGELAHHAIRWVEGQASGNERAS
jgi:DNA-binding NarL/FixJ family response regulator